MVDVYRKNIIVNTISQLLVLSRYHTGVLGVDRKRSLGSQRLEPELNRM